MFAGEKNESEVKEGGIFAKDRVFTRKRHRQLARSSRQNFWARPDAGTGRGPTERGSFRRADM